MHADPHVVEQQCVCSCEACLDPVSGGCRCRDCRCPVGLGDPRYVKAAS